MGCLPPLTGRRRPSTPLAIPSSLMTRLQKSAHDLETCGNVFPTQAERTKYEKAFEQFRRAVFIEYPPSESAAAQITGIVEMIGYSPWWACEVKEARAMAAGEGGACDGGARKDLRVCSRVSTYPYLTS